MKMSSDRRAPLVARCKPDWQRDKVRFVFQDDGVGFKDTRQRDDRVRYPGFGKLSMGEGINMCGMLQAGALAYVRKESAFEEIAAAIESVMRDSVYLGEGVADVVVGQLRHLASQQPAGAAGDLLSGREREVLQLLAEGSKTSEIAAALHVSAKTIKTHRRQIMSKLNLDSVAALTKYAIRTGLVSAER